jgi:hypothetical protein
MEKQYWYELQFQGWIKANNKKDAQNKLEEHFSNCCGINIPFNLSQFGTMEIGKSIDFDGYRAEITHTQVRMLWFKPYNYSRP